MEAIIRLGAVGLFAILALSYAWTWIKPILAKLIPSSAGSTTTGAIDFATTYADEVLSFGALKTAASKFSAHGDVASAASCNELALKVWSWDDTGVVK